MYGISLWQPWASLVAIGAKKVETRHWQPDGRPGDAPIGSRIAIHATKGNYDKEFAKFPAPREALTAAGLDPVHLPCGVIVATVRLARVDLMTPALIEAIGDLSEDELLFGNYEPGRYAWLLKAPARVEPPVPFKGRQARFQDVPDAIATIAPATMPDVPADTSHTPVTTDPPEFEQGSLL